MLSRSLCRYLEGRIRDCRYDELYRAVDAVAEVQTGKIEPGESVARSVHRVTEIISSGDPNGSLDQSYSGHFDLLLAQRPGYPKLDDPFGADLGGCKKAVEQLTTCVENILHGRIRIEVLPWPISAREVVTAFLEESRLRGEDEGVWDYRLFDWFMQEDQSEAPLPARLANLVIYPQFILAAYTWFFHQVKDTIDYDKSKDALWLKCNLLVFIALVKQHPVIMDEKSGYLWSREIDEASTST